MILPFLFCIFCVVLFSNCEAVFDSHESSYIKQKLIDWLVFLKLYLSSSTSHLLIIFAVKYLI